MATRGSSFDLPGALVDPPLRPPGRLDPRITSHIDRLVDPRDAHYGSGMGVS